MALADGERPVPPEDAAAAGKLSPHPEPEAGDGEEEEKQAGGEGDEPPPVLLVADCGTEVHLSGRAARMSKMLAAMMDDNCAADPIPIVGHHAGILRMVAAYCEKHAPYYDPDAPRDRDPFPPFPIELTQATRSIRPVTEPDPDPHGLNDWDQEFIRAGGDNSTLFAIILAANYMEIEDLLDLGCTAVADKMRGKTPEEIRKAFDIENDYTPEQEAEVRRENAWAFRED